MHIAVAGWSKRSTCFCLVGSFGHWEFESRSRLCYYIIEIESYSFIYYNTEASHLHLVDS